jgi:hypothetical protein
VSAAVLPPADSKGLPVRLGLAALLGLVLALLVAGLNETARPAVSGASRVARLLDVPMLGVVRSDPSALGDVGRRVRLAGQQAGVSTIVLARPDRSPLPPELVDRITAATLRPAARAASMAIPIAGFEPPADPGPVTVGGRTTVVMRRATENHNGARSLRQVSSLDELDPAIEHERIGLVVVAGGLTRISAVNDVRDLTTAAGWPLLGVLDMTLSGGGR